MTKQLLLLPNREYIFIDSLYTDTFKEAPAVLQRGTALVELREALFPYTDDPFALFRAESSAFDLARIRGVAEAEERQGLDHFCSDSGLILVVETAAFPAFLDVFDSSGFYFDYIESATGNAHWEAVLAPFATRFSWFFTAEINEAFAGGGSFQIM